MMNITDIDDKIIRRARCAHLFNQYLQQDRSMQELTSDLTAAVQVRGTVRGVVRHVTWPFKMVLTSLWDKHFFVCSGILGQGGQRVR